MVDDQMIGSMVTVLAEPRTPLPDALDRIVASASSARRRRSLTHGFAVVAAVGVIAAVAGVVLPRLSDTAQPSSPFGSGNIRVDGHARVLTMEMPITYPTARRVLHGSFVADGREFDGQFYTDYEDDVLVDSLDVQAGDRIYLDAIVRPNCEGEASAPRALISYRLSNGEESMQVVEADAATQSDYLRERAVWCSVPVHANLAEYSRTAEGKITFTLNVTNTTDHQVEVVLAPMEFAGAVWPRATTTLDAGESGTLSVSPRNYHGGPKPWSEGLLRADGEPVDFNH
jgi:hypothetical protein